MQTCCEGERGGGGGGRELKSILPPASGGLEWEAAFEPSEPAERFLFRPLLKPRKKSGTPGPSCAQEGTTEACLGNCFGCSEPRGEARKSGRRFKRLNSELRARK